LDKQGHKLTLKEAYRQMCWKFHGRMPSHKKREKMAVKEKAQQQQMAAANSLGMIGSVSGASTLGALGSRPKKATKKQ